MKLWVILSLLAAPAFAGVVSAPVRAVPAALAGAASSGAAAVSFDGAGPLRPWLEISGTPYVRVGPTLIDTRSPGAIELLKSATFIDDRPVVGIFETRTARVLNAFSLGSFGVRGHSDALPHGRERAELGGYSVFLSPDGNAIFKGSGSLPATITPAVERSVLRHLGVRPAVLSARERLKRLWLRVQDWAAALISG